MTVSTIDNTPCCTFVAHNARTRRPVPGPGSSRLPSVSAERDAPFRTVFAQKKRTSLRMSSCGIRRRPTLPGRFQPGTISVLRLNFCVRDGNRWIPQAIVTGNFFLRSRAPSKPHRARLPAPRLTSTPRFPPSLETLPTSSPSTLLPGSSDQALDRLVSSGSIPCGTSTDDLSTLSSSRGLTHFM